MKQLVNAVSHDDDVGFGSGVVVGKFWGVSAKGQTLVDYSGNPCENTVSARCSVPLDSLTNGQDVALMFELGDPGKPIILGPIFNPSSTVSEGSNVSKGRLKFVSDKEIIFECGKSSITLTKAGKILLKGKYLLSRSTGVNKIKGGSVQIN